MADYYAQCAMETVKLTATEEEVNILLNEIKEEDACYPSNFNVDILEDNQLFIYAKEDPSVYCLSKVFLKTLGIIISNNNLKHLEFGIAYSCSKMSLNGFSGDRFRIYPDGDILFSENKWPDIRKNNSDCLISCLKELKQELVKTNDQKIINEITEYVKKNRSDLLHRNLWDSVIQTDGARDLLMIGYLVGTNSLLNCERGK